MVERGAALTGKWRARSNSSKDSSVTRGAIHAGNVVLDHGGRWRLTDVALTSTLGLSWSTWVALKRAKQRLGVVATSAGVDWWCFEALCREVFSRLFVW